jgi:hypothetical protein
LRSTDRQRASRAAISVVPNFVAELHRVRANALKNPNSVEFGYNNTRRKNVPAIRLDA